MRAKPKLGMKEICQFLGVSPTTIRHYERFLTEPRYEVADSGHRKFTGSSFTQLYDLRFMSKMGLSVQEATQACQAADAQARAEAYVQGERQLMEQLQYLQASLHEINEVKRCLNMLNSPLGYSLVNAPGFYYLECERDGKILDSPEEIKFIERWTAKIPAVYYINRDIMEDPTGSQWSFRMGLAVAEEYASLVPVNHRGVLHVPARTCVAGIIVDENSESLSSDDYRFSGKCLSRALDFIKNKGLELSGQVFHRLLGSMLTVRDEDGNEVTGDLWYGLYPVK